MGAQPKKSSRLFILLGVVLTLISMMGVYFIAKQATKSSSPGTTQVLVASREIPSHTVFSSASQIGSWLSVLSVPSTTVPIGSFATADAFVKSELSSGKVATSETIYPKEVVLGSMFAGLGSRPTYTNSYGLSTDDVAISMQAPVVDESGGAIQPGDYVDIIASYLPGGGGSGPTAQLPSHPAQTQFVLQNIKVVAIGTWVPSGSGSSSSAASSASTMLTFGVTRKLALIIQNLKDFSGSWETSVVLRSAYSDRVYSTSPIDATYYFNHLRNNFER